MKTQELIKQCALKYEIYKDQLETIDAGEIAQFRQEIEDAYERIFELTETFVRGLRVLFVTGQPYDNLEQMTNGIRSSGVLRISSDNNESRLLPENLNLKFRAVHDYLHYLFQQPFDFKGELNVYKAQKFFHKSEIGKRILYSEIVLQAAYATYFGGFPSQQKVII